MPADNAVRNETNSPRWIALAAAMVPIATFVWGACSQHRELAVAAAEHEFRTRSAYLDRALDPGRPPALRQSVLRFLVKTSDDERLTKWATDELAIVAPEVAGLESALAELRSAVNDKDERVAALIAALDHERKVRKRDAKATAAAHAEIVALNRAKAELEAKIARTTEQLTGTSLGGKSNVGANLSVTAPEGRQGEGGTLSGRGELAPAMGAPGSR